VRAGVPVPSYDRTKVQTGVVHLGVGGFHRAHQALYLDRLLAEGDRQWGVCGVGVLPQDSRMRDVLRAQDGLYTVVEKHADGSLHPRVVGSMVDYLLAPDDPDGVVERLAGDEVRVVSLTITEGGYSTGTASPVSAFSLLSQGLARRRKRGLPPFTVVSCDNVQSNGELARRTLAAFARRDDPELGAWIEAEVSFPNSMVDRITPVTTDEDRQVVSGLLGVADGWPVVCESFTQWVLEDRFPAGRPGLERVGVQLVPDVHPYELMKLRLLNGGHQALAYLGHLCGHSYVHEAAQDPLIARFVRAYMDLEASPTLDPVPGVDLDGYKRTLLERFANTGIRDTLARICQDASDRIPVFLLPVVRSRLSRGEPVTLAALVVAAWARYAEGSDEQGRPIDVVDRHAARLTAAAHEQRTDPLAFLRVREVFGDLAEQAAFGEAYVAALASLHERGARATLERALRDVDAAAGS
jgi:mannitol 2-dehydrogenase